MKQLFLATALIGSVCGCAIARPSTKPPSASAPRENMIDNTVSISKGFDEVWQGLVEHLSANYTLSA
jgi:hypothetical protein